VITLLITRNQKERVTGINLACFLGFLTLEDGTDIPFVIFPTRCNITQFSRFDIPVVYKSQCKKECDNSQ